MDAETAKEFSKIAKMTHSRQAVWFLNGFWPPKAAEADKLGEDVWGYVQKFQELENGGPVIRFKGKKGEQQKEYVEGCDLDPHQSHRFLESLGETLTVTALREKLATMDVDKSKRLALCEYLLFKYKKTPRELVDAPQGTDNKALAQAQAKMDQVAAAIREVQQNMNEVENQTEECKNKIAQVKQKLMDQKAQEKANEKALADLAKAKEELAKALADLKKEEEAFAKAKKAEEAKANDSSLGVVKRNHAKAMLAQMEAKDPMPLDRAKITQAAALKKTEKGGKAVTKAQAALEKAIVQSQEAQKELEASQVLLEQSKKELEKSQAALEVQMKEAEDELEEVKKKGVSAGAVWWMERELKEARRFGVKKKK